MSEFNEELRLKKALIGKYGDACSICGKPNELTIYYIHEQEYLELQYFDSLEERFKYYLEYFDKESDFLGLVHEQCKSKNEVKQPSLEEIMVNVHEIIKDKQFEKLDDFMVRYRQTIPIILRMDREIMAEEE